MSDAYTEVSTSAGGIGEWGHVEPQDAIAELRSHYEREARTAAAVLAEIDAGRVRVYHQYGPWTAAKRRCVFPADEQVSA